MNTGSDRDIFIDMNCINHTDKPAQFQCINCGMTVCNACVKSFQAGGFFTYFCPACNSQCEEIEIKPEPAPKKAPPVSSPPPSEVTELPPADISSPAVDVLPQELTDLPEEVPQPKATPAEKPVKSAPASRTGVPPPEAAPKIGFKKRTDEEASAPSLSTTPAVTAEIKTPFLAGQFLKMLIKPSETFPKILSLLDNSLPLKIQLMFLTLVFFLTGSFLKELSLGLTPLFFSLVSTLVFSLIMILPPKNSVPLKSGWILFLGFACLFSLLETLQNGMIFGVQNFMPPMGFPVLPLLFLLLKLWIFMKTIDSICRSGALLSFLVSLTSISAASFAALQVAALFHG